MKRRKRIRLAAALGAVVAVTVAAAAQAATFFVAQGNEKSNDDGPGSVEQPWKTLAKAVATAGAGDVVVVGDGVYREELVVRASGAAGEPICFEAAPGAHVVLTGADRLTSWKKTADAGEIYSVPWPHKFIGWNPRMTHPDDEYHRLIGRCEQFIIDGYLQRQVLEQAQLAPGAFWVDIAGQRLEAWDIGGRDLNHVTTEASARQEILRVEGNYVTVRGLHFRFAANMAQHGAVVLAGAHDVLEDCALEDMNASGATFSGEDEIARRCVFRDNGQLGFGANGAHRLLFTECVVENNNTKGFDRGWEAGGDKLVLTRGAVLERSRFARNRGSGIWFDIGNEGCVVRQCLIADNEDAGIFDEISYGLTASDNVITGNGFASTAGAWGAQAGICLSSSPGSVIERNLIIGNREGLDFREQKRTTPRIGQAQGSPEEAVWVHDETVRRNIIAFNRDAQIWGWFDVGDGRHWPAADTTAPANRQMTLEKLHLKFQGNIYYAAPGQKWFEWGTSWGRHMSYPTLEAFARGLGIDEASQALNPQFRDVNARDYRVSAAAMNALQECYPRQAVPGCLLGTGD